MKDFKNTEIIEAYLEGELAGQEQEQFEQSMAVDEKLAEMVQKAKNGIQAIRIAGQMELKKKLQEIHDSEISTAKVRMLPVFIRYAAVFVAVASIAIIMWYSFSSQNNYSNLYSQNFEPYTNLLTVKGESDGASEQSLVNAAMYQYDLKNYDNANQAFQKLLTYKQNNDTILFYYGISKLGSGQAAEAISLFHQLLEQKESLFYRFGHAKWYLALAYLQEAGKYQDSDSSADNSEVEGLINQSKKLLTEIVAENGDYSNNAEEILQKLE
jgi:tetratricopeptide (TPR) repeat protein